jgi:hypothetical protein
MTERRRARVLVLFSLLALAGCELLEEKIREGQVKPPPPDNGGGPVTEPGAPLPPPAPEVACASTSSCPAGQRCSTERGVCQSPPGCDRPGVACPAVCYGTCEGPGKPVDPGPGPAQCAVDADCRLFSDYCTGCDCRVLAKGQPDPVCSGPGVRCLVDPCGDLVAFCSAGRCGSRSTRPTPPPPPSTCVGEGEGSESTCRSTGEWKERAYVACRNKGLQLQNYWPGGDCGPDRYRYVKYECCGPVPPTPPLPPPPPAPPSGGSCFGGNDGGPTSCKSPDVWKTYASDICASRGFVLRDLAFDTECGGGNYRYMKFACCSAAPPPPPPPPPPKCSADSDCPLIRIACKQCPDGSASCPSSRCQGGVCQIIFPTCGGAPTPPPPPTPWDPCAKKKCGDTCSLCPPFPSNCAETKDIKTCNRDLKCVSGPPSACR